MRYFLEEKTPVSQEPKTALKTTNPEHNVLPKKETLPTAANTNKVSTNTKPESESVDTVEENLEASLEKNAEVEEKNSQPITQQSIQTPQYQAITTQPDQTKYNRAGYYTNRYGQTSSNQVAQNNEDTPTALLFSGTTEAPQFDTFDDEKSTLLESVISATSTQVELTKDKALLINLNAPITRATISNSEIAQAIVLSPTQIQLIGRELGTANLILWPSYGERQQVIDIFVQSDLSAIRKQLKMIHPSFNITSAVSNETLLLTGNTESPEQAQLAKELSRSFFISRSSNEPAPNVINLIKVNGRPSTKLSQVQDKLSQVHPNIQINMVPEPDGIDKAVLTGKVPSADLVSRAINTASIFYGLPGLKVVTGPGGNAVQSDVSDVFHTGESFSSNVAVNVLQGSIITDMSGNVVSMLQVTERPQIRCSIQFLEISRNDLNQLGSSIQGISGNTGYGNLIGSQNSARSFSTINAAASSAAWSVAPNDVQANTSALSQTLADGATQVFTLGSQASVYLSALIEKRQVRSLAEPTLTMLSGEKASFLAGGEVPVPVSLLNGQVSVSFKDFGIRLNLIPTVIENELIHLQVAPEVSTVDTTIFVNAGELNIPGFRTRRMQTTLEMHHGENLVLAGLYNNDDIRTIS